MARGLGLAHLLPQMLLVLVLLLRQLLLPPAALARHGRLPLRVA